MNLHRAKKIIDDVALVLRDMDSANSRVLAEALGNACNLLEDAETKASGLGTKASGFQGWSIDDIEEGRAPLSILRQYKQVRKEPGQKILCKEDYVDQEFLDQLREV